ncbi:hypothetical protein BDY21DRAFT_375043 [Lineolata rhizophorae]|uniref:Rhodopsin domain-containing protein n=1 Tax=Lineolata rhizophorae TaxID=578093 RepID=A0A6A6NPD7_9PEZI|nr:hypothetical protein BDY21DRAFT_375043 [Lineolata rhizophorae]
MAENLGPTVLITGFTLTGFSTFILALRFYCRYFRIGSLKAYDFLMLAALLVTWGITVINHFQVKNGSGRHTRDLPTEPSVVMPLLEGTLKSWYVYQIVYLVDLAVIKFSILAFYAAISSYLPYRVGVYLTMAVVAAFTVAMVFVNAFECSNPSDAWSPEFLFQETSSCRNLHPIYFAQAGFNILTDIIIILLPMPILNKLNLKRSKKFGLLGVFSVGLIAVGASGARVHALFVWSNSSDVPFDSALILTWSQIELNAAIISASIPSLKPLFSCSCSSSDTTSTASTTLGFTRRTTFSFLRRVRSSHSARSAMTVGSYAPSANSCKEIPAPMLANPPPPPPPPPPAAALPPLERRTRHARLFAQGSEEQRIAQTFEAFQPFRGPWIDLEGGKWAKPPPTLSRFSGSSNGR